MGMVTGRSHVLYVSRLAILAVELRFIMFICFPRIILLQNIDKGVLQSELNKVPLMN